jgi:hypothetical protein
MYFVSFHTVTKGVIFGKNVIGHEMRVLIFSSSETFLILRRIQRGPTTNLHISSWRGPFILVRF